MRGCPSAQDLEGLIEERLGDSESASLARHVDSCPDCQLTLERPPVVQLLHKICHAPQRAIAEYLIAHPTPLRESLRSEA